MAPRDEDEKMIMDNPDSGLGEIERGQTKSSRISRKRTAQGATNRGTMAQIWQSSEICFGCALALLQLSHASLSWSVRRLREGKIRRWLALKRTLHPSTGINETKSS